MTPRAALIPALITAAIFALSGSGVAAGYLEDPVATANMYRNALMDRNIGTALSLLAPDALFYQSGEEQRSREEYSVQQLKRDAAELSTYYTNVVNQKSDVQGNLAWVSTRLRLLGKTAEDSAPIFVTETQILRRAASGWQIVHVHRSFLRPPDAP